MSGSLIAEYILREKKEKGELPENAAIVETIVTTDMLKAVAEKYGVKLMEVLTGFKFIGEQIKLFEQNNSYEYIFGMEESYGCLAGTYARDKDACVAVMMLCEVAAYYKLKGMTLCDAMQDMYKEYGYYKEGLFTITKKGIDGAEQIENMMREKRENPATVMGGFKVLKMRDYQSDEVKDMVTGETGTTGLPKSNVLYYELGTYARDKDACVAVMMLCEVAAYYKLKGMTLCDAMQDMYKEYGYYKEGLFTITKKGIDGAEQIENMMREKRENPATVMGGFKVLKMRDYQSDEVKDMVTGETGTTGLPKSNVLYYELENNAWCCVRPSGTEPKIKFYYGVKGESLEDAEKKLEAIKEDLI